MEAGGSLRFPLASESAAGSLQNQMSGNYFLKDKRSDYDSNIRGDSLANLNSRGFILALLFL